MTIRSLHKCLALALGACAALSHLPAAGQANPLARGLPQATHAAIEGAWNGANLERRTNCTNSQNNGSRGTYAQFNVTTDQGRFFGIDETAITGLRCTYSGDYATADAGARSTGTYSCSDGKHGTYQTKGILVTENALSIRMDIQLDTTESCAVDAVIGGSRFYP